MVRTEQRWPSPREWKLATVLLPGRDPRTKRSSSPTAGFSPIGSTWRRARKPVSTWTNGRTGVPLRPPVPRPPRAGHVLLQRQFRLGCRGIGRHRECLGYDSTQKTIELAEANAALNGIANAQFRLEKAPRCSNSSTSTENGSERGRPRSAQVRPHAAIGRGGPAAYHLTRPAGALALGAGRHLCHVQLFRPGQPEDFFFMLLGAAQAGRRVQVLEQRGASPQPPRRRQLLGKRIPQMLYLPRGVSEARPDADLCPCNLATEDIEITERCNHPVRKSGTTKVEMDRNGRANDLLCPSILFAPSRCSRCSLWLCLPWLRLMPTRVPPFSPSVGISHRFFYAIRFPIASLRPHRLSVPPALLHIRRRESESGTNFAGRGPRRRHGTTAIAFPFPLVTAPEAEKRAIQTCRSSKGYLGNWGAHDAKDFHGALLVADRRRSMASSTG